MRGKRSKAYKKLMSAYGHTFGFRAPYQVLLDSDLILDSVKHKMELVSGLEKVLHGQIKPMVTQCSIRHLYLLSVTTDPTSTTSNPPSSSPSTLPPVSKQLRSTAIDLAKSFERRRCNHHTLSEPLPSFACIQSCLVSPAGENKHRYIVATQNKELRAYLRSIPGVPLVYINRSVMIMEPMADVSWERREKEEWGKFTVGLKEGERRKVEDGAKGEAKERKRKRVEDADGTGEEEAGESKGDGEGERRLRRRRAPRQPNPLSVKKKKNALPVKFLPNPARKKKGEPPALASFLAPSEKKEVGHPEVKPNPAASEAGGEMHLKKKRRRKHRSSKAVGGEGERNDEAAVISV